MKMRATDFGFKRLCEAEADKHVSGGRLWGWKTVYEVEHTKTARPLSGHLRSEIMNSN